MIKLHVELSGNGFGSLMVSLSLLDGSLVCYIPHQRSELTGGLYSVILYLSQTFLEDRHAPRYSSIC